MQSKSKKASKHKPIAKATHPVPSADPRFQQASYDPKFKSPSPALAKTRIDQRFTKAIQGSSFNSASGVDRYGRRHPINHQQDLRQYYSLEGEQEGDQMGEEEKSSEEEGGIGEWMQNYQEESSELEEVEWEEEGKGDVWSEEEEGMVRGEEVKATRRLALCNYDWMNISCKDLMLLFSSFKNQTGTVRSVRVFISNIGKEKLAEEERNGPQGIWRQQQEDVETKEWRKTWKEMLQERARDNDAFDERLLRQYEKERLKYFYAVVECDSAKTADSIYRECDGNQFEHSNHTFDLRFIPDDLQLPQDNKKEECHQLPQSGEVKNFITRALGHSKVTLSWEDPQLSLAADLKNKNWAAMTEEQIEKVDWSRYIDEAQQDNQNTLRKMVRTQQEAVVPDWKQQTNNKSYKKASSNDIQITFEGGFDKSHNHKQKSHPQKQQPSLKQQRKSLKARRKEQEEDRARKREQLRLMVGEETQKEAKVDLQDQRFQAVYSDPAYAMDPQDPRFDHRKSGRVFQEVVRRNRKRGQR